MQLDTRLASQAGAKRKKLLAVQPHQECTRFLGLRSAAHATAVESEARKGEQDGKGMALVCLGGTCVRMLCPSVCVGQGMGNHTVLSCISAVLCKASSSYMVRRFLFFGLPEGQVCSGQALSHHVVLLC